MTYFQEVEQWLEDLGEEFGISEGLKPEDWAEFKRQLKDKILESYRNGQKAGPKEDEKRSGKRFRARGGFKRNAKRQET